MNIGFGEHYITHIKLITKNGNYIENGDIKNDTTKIKGALKELNDENNVILNISFLINPLGLRAIGANYMNFKDFYDACGFSADKPNIFNNKE